MRIARLDLLRYGRFTDVSIELPRAERDIHIVFGPNEAGKTTSLTAIEDMLFGIHERSPYSFLHSYQTMCIGAVLEGSGDRFEFQRLKKRRDMILGPDGNPLPGDERLLAPFLGGADRDYFDRMFNLSHGRLAEGGRAIIEAKDDVGQMLFAAGTGLADLRERLKKLEEEAKKLWAPRKARDRLYYQAQNRWDEAKSRQRKHEVSVSEWKEAHKKSSDSEETLHKRQKEHEEKSKELKKLIRIRHVHGAIRQKRELTQEIMALGDVIELAEDANQQLAQAEQQDAMVGAQIEIFAAQLNEDRQALEAITFDAALVRRSGEIEQLNEQRITVRSEREDLPKRRDEYCVELKSLGRLAAEIGWNFEKPSELIERIPPRSKVEPVRELLTQHEKLTAEQRSVRKALDESQDALQDKRERLNEIGEATDVSRLAAVLDDVREIGDVADRICREQRQVTEISCEIDKKVRLLRPALPAGTDIEALAVPPRDMVVAHRDDVRDWARRQGETKQQLTEARNHLERDQKALERRVRDEGVMGLGAVEEARSDRGALWDLVKAQYITRLKISSEDQQAYAEALDDLPASFEGAVAQADIVADRRFDKAKAAAELVLLERKIAGHKTHISQLEVSKAELKVEGERQDQKWQELWAELPIELLAPDVMLVWLEARREVVTLIGREREMQCQLDNSRREEQKAIAQVHAELTKLGWDSGDIMGDSLGVVVRIADAYRQKQEAKAQKIVDMYEAVRTAKSEVIRRQSELERVEAERKNWQADWTNAVAAIGFRADNKTELLSEHIKVIDKMRDHAAAARNLRDKRIATIERDIRKFERAVAKIAAELAADLVNSDSDAIVMELDRRRYEALKRHQKCQELTDKVTEKQRKIEELEEDRKTALASLRLLLKAAGVETIEELREAIERSDRLRTLKEKLDDVRKSLDQQGDGLAIEVLEEECRGVDIDEALARKDIAEAELEELSKQKEEAAVALNDARRDFKAIGGDDGAARAAADCEEALADMQYAAERYVRVRASEILLRWAVDRYRKEKQGPLLKRAGELFRVLTRSSFERLEVTFDGPDTMQLTGVRPTTEKVAVRGLSSGTEDQLFLSLRIAAVEDYLARAVALPFVADDLFINFDQERSASGFEVLGRLSERTQVLFYTHHQHLVDVARETLGADVNVVMLAEVKKRAPKEA